MGQFDPKKGTITFWVDGDKIVNPQQETLFGVNSEDGGINLTVEDGYLNYYHSAQGYGKTHLKYSLDEFEEDQKYHVVLRWSSEEEKIDLFIDGEEVASTSMD